MNVDLPAVFGIGVMTLATPCVLPLLPIYLGMLMGESLEAARSPRGRFRLLSSTAAFAAGFTLVFTLLGLGASTVGSALAAHREALMLAGGLLILLFGLKFFGLLRLPWLNRELRLPELRTGRRLVDAGLFGVVFALGWTPCVGPILGSVLTYTASRAADPLTGALYLGVYSLGVATPLLVLSLFVDRLLPLLSRLNRALPTLEKVTGGLLILVGAGLMITAAARLDLWTTSPPATEAVEVVEVAGPSAVGQPSERPRLVEFYREGCQACERARLHLDALREDCAGRAIEILTLDAEAPDNRPLARRYAVAVVPTFVLLDAEGRERGRLVGAPELNQLRGAAASLMDESCVAEDPAAPPAVEENDAEDEDAAGCPSAVEADPWMSQPADSCAG